jgi:hypothetical protein
LSESGVRWFINSEKDDQPTAPYLTPTPMLHYQRMDVRLDSVATDADARPEHAQRLLERPLAKAEAQRLRDIASAHKANLNLLNELGVEAGFHYMNVAAPPTIFDLPAWPKG